MRTSTTSSSASVAASAAAGPRTDKPTPLGDVVAQYHIYVGQKLTEMAKQVSALHASVAAGNRAQSQQRWLAAQFSWQQVGAAYGSFGAAGTAINGLAAGLPRGVADPGFTGLHRIEYGLYHDEPMRSVLSHVAKLTIDLASLRANLDKTAITPTDMPIRCHEILEDALRDHLCEMDDYGSGMGYALTAGDVLATRVVLDELKPLIPSPVLGHSPYDVSKAALDVLDAALAATKVHGNWPDYRALSKHQRQPVNGAIGAALEALYQVPFVLSKVI